MMTLFDYDFQRTETRWKLQNESEYNYLNNSARPGIEAFRNVAENWFQKYPKEGRKDLRSRFRSQDDIPHAGAFFELFLHEIFTKMGFLVNIHNKEGKKPDFLFSKENYSLFYLEGTVINCRKDFDLHNNKVIAQVYDSINNINSPNFFLWVRIEGTISSAPSVRKERIKIERWLENLDPDNYYKFQKSADIYKLPIYKWEFQGSIIQLIAVAKPPCLRGKQGIRPIEAYLPDGVKQIDNAPMIKRSISDKAGRYGVFDIPYIIATNILGIFPDHTDVVDALFGQEAVRIRNSEGVDEEVLVRCKNGVFIGPKGPQNTRVSAVLVFFDLNPFNLASNQPVLYHNPWASKPLLLNEFPFDQVVYTSNFNQIPAKISLGNLLDLPTPWPIPDDRDST